MASAIPHSPQKKAMRPGWAPIRAMIATCCAVEPLHGSPCATITPKMKANAAAVTIQLSVLARILPGRRAPGCPTLMLDQPITDQSQLVLPASSPHGSTMRSSRPGTRAILEQGGGMVWTRFMGSSQCGQLACGWGMGGHSLAREQLQPTAPILTIAAPAALPEDALGRLRAWPAAALTCIS
jgi:hypothetical protein